MGLADRNSSLPQFDKVPRTHQAEILLSMIYATHWEWLNHPDNEENRKRGIESRLKPLYDIFKKKGAGTYGNHPDNISRQFSRQYTIGHDMGIWTGRDLELSEYAKEIATNKVPVADYITRVFLNLFSYINNRYIHFLYDICSYLVERNKTDFTKEDIVKALGIEGENIINQEEKSKYVNTAREQASIILNYLSSTYFFTVLEGEQGDTDKLTFAPNYTPSIVKDLCNLEYRSTDGEKTREFFTDKSNYANYIAKPSKGFEWFTFNQKENKEIKSDIPENTVNTKEGSEIIQCDLRDVTIQKIIYGPPGIGKSYSITSEIQESYGEYSLKDENPYVFRTTLHPEYSYNDFVGQIMPIVKDDEITYDFTPGIFTQALKKAVESPTNDVYLVLEEMSRANVAAIFGDIFQLLDRKNGVSEYRINHDLISKEIYNSKRKIYLPKNLHIIGTVNTSDQNVYVMDTAFKRRFDFEYMSLEPLKDEETNELLNQFDMVFENSNNSRIESNWIEFYQVLNRYIVKDLKLSEDKQVGQFFIQFSTDDQVKNKKAIYNKLLQYLWQDIHMASFSNKSLFQEHFETFSEAYGTLKKSLESGKPINIFSDDFLDEIKSFRDGNNE